MFVFFVSALTVIVLILILHCYFNLQEFSAKEQFNECTNFEIHDRFIALALVFQLLTTYNCFGTCRTSLQNKRPKDLYISFLSVLVFDLTLLDLLEFFRNSLNFSNVVSPKGVL